MNGHILNGKIIVVPVIGIKIFHFLFIERDPDVSCGAAAGKVTAVSDAGDFFWKRRGKTELYEKLLVSVSADVLIGLYFFGFGLFGKQVTVGKDREDMEHPGQIVIVMTEDGLVPEPGLVFYKFMINTDQLPAVKRILPMDSQKLLQCFLLAVGQF